ncbi:hypothetical protein CXG46_04970 [Nocardioides alpinus]|uniref:Uncharacterized protein n=1 Tax=Nocardioides alpinus TaxID=748909 RepID=A0ABX4R1M1_9ACTN|nr:hypothetical protein CXG46_04970 [Nocardioides alpinus]
MTHPYGSAGRGGRGNEHDRDADEATGKLHTGSQAAEDGAGDPAVLARHDEGGRHQSRHQEVVVETGDAVGDHQR